MRLILTLPLIALLASCQPRVVTVPVCPAVPHYTDQQLAEFAKELNTLKRPSVVRSVLVRDYGSLRAQLQINCPEVKH